MALEPKCDACEAIRETSSTFTVNGLTENMCTSLKNNTGLSTSDNHNDCKDLNNLNDCLIGNMEKEVSAYAICDWKSFMKNFIPNLWTMLKAMICAICGLWDKVESMNFDEIWCWLHHLAEPQATETLAPDDPKVRYRAVDGVTTRYDPEHPRPNDSPLRITVIGSTARVTGSLKCDGNMPASYTGSGSRRAWTDYAKGKAEFTNQYGRSSYDGNLPAGGVLMYEYEVKACDWGFSELYNAPLLPAEAGDFIARVRTVRAGSEYPFDCGWDANGNGQIYTPSSNKFDTLIQIRMEYINSWGNSLGNITPNGTVLVKPCTDSWEC